MASIDSSSPVIVRMLYPDDDSSNHSIFAMLLESHNNTLATSHAGHRLKCDHAMSGPEAAKMYKESLDNDCPYHLLITDFIMPDWDGLATAKAIRELTKKIFSSKSMADTSALTSFIPIPRRSPDETDIPQSAPPLSSPPPASVPLSPAPDSAPPLAINRLFEEPLTEFPISDETPLPIIMIFSSEEKANRRKIEEQCFADGTIAAYLKKPFINKKERLFPTITRIAKKYRPDLFESQPKLLHPVPINISSSSSSGAIDPSSGAETLLDDRLPVDESKEK